MLSLCNHAEFGGSAVAYAGLLLRIHCQSLTRMHELLLHMANLFVLLADLSYKELSGRPKNLWGVYNKMQLKRQKLDSIYDLRAIRVIVRDKTDCYSVLRQVCAVFWSVHSALYWKMRLANLCWGTTWMILSIYCRSEEEHILHLKLVLLRHHDDRIIMPDLPGVLLNILVCFCCHMHTLSRSHSHSAFHYA